MRGAAMPVRRETAVASSRDLPKTVSTIFSTSPSTSAAGTLFTRHVFVASLADFEHT